MVKLKAHRENRLTFPDRWFLVLEDDLSWQALFASKLGAILGPQGRYVGILAPSAVFGIASWHALRERNFAEPSFILVDHDMPLGNGMEFMEWLAELPYEGKICAVSGVDQNNANLQAAGAHQSAKKGDWQALEMFLEEFKEKPVEFIQEKP